MDRSGVEKRTREEEEDEEGGGRGGGGRRAAQVKSRDPHQTWWGKKDILKWTIYLTPIGKGAKNIFFAAPF